MPDASHVFGGDLSFGPSGDLAAVLSDAQTKQRVTRRLLTNLGGYIWQSTYGGGFPAFVGAPVTADQLSAIATAQMALEASVLQSPAPSLTATADPYGNVTVTIVYATSNGAQKLVTPLS